MGFTGQNEQNKFMQIGSWQNSPNNTVDRLPLGGERQDSTTEQQTQVPIPYEIIVETISVRSRTNGKNGDCVMSLRVNEADVSGAVITIGAGVITPITLDDINTLVAKDALMNWQFDNTASSSGSNGGCCAVGARIT